MRITVELTSNEHQHGTYGATKHTIETPRDDLTFQELMDMIKDLVKSLGYSCKLVEEYFDED